jgi:CHAD domain-containing protein
MGDKKNKVIELFGVEYLLNQVKIIENEIQGTLTGDDIEHVHKMRVASRRLRNGLILFEDSLPAKKVPKWQDEIRKITRSLGSGRDLDIQIERINHILHKSLDQSFRPGIDRLLIRLTQKRTKAQTKIEKTLNELIADGSLEKMARRLEKSIEDSGQSPRPTHLLFQIASRSIHKQLEDFLTHEPFIWDETNIKELHAMRISGKHLRYSLETFAPIYNKALLSHFLIMKEVQDLLGEIHDLDVWANWLPLFIEQEKNRIDEFYGNTNALEPLLPGLQYLLESFKILRFEKYQTFIMTWKSLVYEKAWENLEEIIDSFISIEESADNLSAVPQQVMSQVNSYDQEGHNENSGLDDDQIFQIDLTAAEIDPDHKEPAEDQPPDWTKELRNNVNDQDSTDR